VIVKAVLLYQKKDAINRERKPENPIALNLRKTIGKEKENKKKN